jgi:hypothetical protein
MDFISEAVTATVDCCKHRIKPKKKKKKRRRKEQQQQLTYLQQECPRYALQC